MTFLALGTTTCFLCERPIATRALAAQLPYARPEEVGELARRGRSWVHRACWTGWAMRDAWARSAALLMTGQPGMLAVRGVVGMATPRGVLVTDTDAALAVTVPREAIDPLRAAFEAARATTLSFDHAAWTLTPDGAGIRLTAVHDDEPFEDLAIDDPGAWAAVLCAAAAPVSE
ncbi:MAG: hypothetical protein ABIY55_17115 [Kofleriaceae bacterium]